MSIFYHEEEEVPNPSKRCKFLATCLMDAFSNCNMSRRLQTASPEAEGHPASDDFDDEQELIVSTIRSRAMEKLKRKPSGLSLTDSFSWVYSTKTGELFITQNGVQKKEECEDEEADETEEFLTVASCFSCCSSSAAASKDVFLSVKTSLSRCSSLDGFEFNFNDFQKRQSIIQQLCHCEGWPFGLCRKAVLLPPLPKSPSESWTWRKGIATKSKSLPSKSHTS
ncbi:hypothetical protein RchiOBHm_Chr6g0307431 [Rosa chinensis]|uniref:Uncharacterized protein n=1 Tax=Rosa chinensis TaxID=74649 RepID=A0A2P6Q0J4_ROSCH|nr:uncharacterized protein LOC112174183 [Rosa chinensis]PRQ27639.1 hypothetical protein RchiOBHm_Chr6g0307431 [Rosa chinensis]